MHQYTAFLRAQGPQKYIWQQDREMRALQLSFPSRTPSASAWVRMVGAKMMHYDVVKEAVVANSYAAVYLRLPHT